MQRFVPLAILILGTLLAAFRLERQATPTEVIEDCVEAVHEFLQSLPADQRAAGFFSYDDQEQRELWSNLPEGMFERKGWRLGDLSPEARNKAWDILRSFLSEDGFEMARANVLCDEVLRIRHGRPSPLYGSDEFFLSFLGTPSATEPWILQFGGHHLALDAHFSGGRILLNPMMNGGNPMNFEWPLIDKDDSRPDETLEVRQMSREIDIAFELAASLSPEQRKRAVLAEEHIDWKFGPQRTVPIEPAEEGLPASALDADQRTLLTAILAERVEVLHPAHSAPVMDELEAELDRTWFAWYGPTAAGSAASYRIQGPSVLLEFAPQGRASAAMGHVHAIYWDPGLER
ncbi:MAG: DUF3500 domain-containing protein [Planctomycetota bacterium]|jgi:hypothetical protein